MLFTGLAGSAWSHLWPGAAVGSYALIGGGAFLAAAMQGPALVAIRPNLWRLTPRDLAALNAYESLDSGLYVRRVLRAGVAA